VDALPSKAYSRRSSLPSLAALLAEKSRKISRPPRVAFFAPMKIALAAFRCAGQAGRERFDPLRHGGPLAREPGRELEDDGVEPCSLGTPAAGADLALGVRGGGL
jgi:hypothetical protein